MITNEDVFHAMKTLQVFCDGFDDTCSGCPLKSYTCEFSRMITDAMLSSDIMLSEGLIVPAYWNVERLRPRLSGAE